MDFSFTEDQTAIADLAAQIFTDRATDEFMLAFSRSGETIDKELWNTLAEQGLLALAIPESCGGSGLGFMELALVLQEQGRRVAPVPLLNNLVMAALPLAKYGSEDQQQKYLTPLAAGEHQLSAAIADTALPEARRIPVSIEEKSNGWVISGSKHGVPFGSFSNAILVPARDNQGKTSVFIVETNQSGVSVEAQRTMLGETLATLNLDQVEVSQAALLGQYGQGDEIVTWIEQHTNAALCGMQLGVTEEALKRTAEFTSERKQFGAPIGSFQAVAMRAADAYMEVETIRSTFWQAAWRLSEGLDAELAVRAAKYWCCMGGHRVVHTAQHLHGGMGSDIEFPIHRFFLWSKQIEHVLGSGTIQLKQLGEALARDDKAGLSALAV